MNNLLFYFLATNQRVLSLILDRGVVGPHSTLAPNLEGVCS